MGDVAQFPGAVGAHAVTQEEFDLAAAFEWQCDLLVRWKVFGEEVKRRGECPLPFDLALELAELLREIDG